MAHWGITTDLMFNRAAGEVRIEGRYTVIRTPAAPDYYFGNMLVLGDAPHGDGLPTLEADFARLIGTPPVIQHRTFLWPVNGEPAFDPQPFTGAGYAYAESTVLLASPRDLLEPDAINTSISIRPYRDLRDWDDWQVLFLAENAGMFPGETYLTFMLGQQAMYRDLIEAGRGDWWGAFIGEEQVANLGLFFEGRTGRFQSVITAASHRNQRICKTLVHHVAREGLKRADRLVMVADEHYHAARVYESLGFRRQERMASLCWYPSP
jgi:ribosomal protein S18 acetylase RimI-like enzyme